MQWRWPASRSEGFGFSGWSVRRIGRQARRVGFTGLLCLAGLPAAAPGEDGWTAESLFEQVTELAAARSKSAFEPPVSGLPEALRDISYDQYRAIRFRPEQALWRGETRFEVQFFHPGFLFPYPVRLNTLESGVISPIAFRQDLFRYDAEAAALEGKGEGGNGFAGFRLHYPLNTDGHKDEVMVFLGASYFRLVGPGQVYGLSTRGLAIDTASPEGEEFPAFREFWLVRPGPEADRVTILALLDSPSVSGAYRFDLTAGEEVAVDVEKYLFARTDVGKLGVAPLTSMYHFGATSERSYDDFRPRVHDSEGLQVLTGAGEWIWRPLANPRAVRGTSLRDRDPGGFGLVQRNREFADYLDMEAEYHRRPSQWVTPMGGDWGAGGVELVEIPAPDETIDNIVAFWVGDRPFSAGERRHYRYRLTVFDDTPPGDPPARVVRTRSGWGAVPGAADPPPRSLRRYIVDFAGGALEGLGPDAAVGVQLDTSAGRLDDVHVRRLPDGEGWRATFLLDPAGGRAADLRLLLTLDGAPVTETWNHVWYPDEL
ncbi:glucan biosynthesis protein [Thioalkalivibrio sp.]|uniref:glucan biosynthesis protein n=1 Tax=Thioalkalivibrio sp. TaxID=2093813 RepID=UPI00356B26CE